MSEPVSSSHISSDGLYAEAEYASSTQRTCYVYMDVEDLREEPGEVRIAASFPPGVEVDFKAVDPSDSVVHLAYGLWMGRAGADKVLNLSTSMYPHVIASGEVTISIGLSAD